MWVGYCNWIFNGWSRQCRSAKKDQLPDCWFKYASDIIYISISDLIFLIHSLEWISIGWKEVFYIFSIMFLFIQHLYFTTDLHLLIFILVNPYPDIFYVKYLLESNSLRYVDMNTTTMKTLKYLLRKHCNYT